jgi:hypothetical protein
VGQTGRPHQLGQPGGRSFDDLVRRLRRDVAGPEPGAARRDDQACARVHLSAQRRDYCGSIVGNDHPIDVRITKLRQVTFGEIAGFVLASAVRDTVTDGDNGNARLEVPLDG